MPENMQFKCNYVQGKENRKGTSQKKNVSKKQNAVDDDFIVGVGDSPLRKITLNVSNSNTFIVHLEC